MEKEQEIKDAIEDSEEYFKKCFPNMNPDSPVISMDNVKDGIKCLAIANEICTLKWILGQGKLNCYETNK